MNERIEKKYYILEKDKIMEKLPYLKKIIRGKIHFGQKILRKG